MEDRRPKAQLGAKTPGRTVHVHIATGTVGTRRDVDQIGGERHALRGLQGRSGVSAVRGDVRRV